MSKDISGFASDRTAPLQIVVWGCLNTEGQKSLITDRLLVCGIH